MNHQRRYGFLSVFDETMVICGKGMHHNIIYEVLAAATLWAYAIATPMARAARNYTERVK